MPGMRATIHPEAVKKAIVNNIEPGEVPPGLYPFNHIVELQITGAAERLENGLAKPKYDLPLDEMLAVALSRAGVVGPLIVPVVQDLLDDAKTHVWINGHLDAVRAALKQVRDTTVAGMELVPRAGAFKGAVQVEVVKTRKAR